MIRNKLVDLRANKSRPEVAEALKITPQMLGAIERGDRTPSLNLAKKISDYYGVSVDEIFFNQKRNESCLKENTSGVS
jgi:putative transcriptional regulator